MSTGVLVDPEHKGRCNKLTAPNASKIRVTDAQKAFYMLLTTGCCESPHAMYNFVLL